MKRLASLLSVLLPAALLAALLYPLLRPSALRSQPAANPEPAAQFRIVVGLTDESEKPWEGRVTVTGAELASLAGWRFSDGDSTESSGRFSFRTKAGNLENQLLSGQPYGQTGWLDPKIQRLIPQGLIVRTRGGEGGRIRFESGSGSFSFGGADARLGKALTVMNGNARVERMPTEEKLSAQGAASDFPALAIAPDGTRWVAWLAYQNGADRILVRGGDRTYDLTAPGDHHAPAIAADGQGSVWAVWPRNDAGTFHLYARIFDGRDWSAPRKLTSAGGSNIWPRIASDGQGKLALVWQGFRNNQSVILGRRWNGAAWSAEMVLSEGPGNNWTPAVAFGGGKLWVTWDSYATGSYQIYARQWSGPVAPVTRGDNFNVRPSLAVTSQGRPIVAWEESDAAWGKDFTFLLDRRGASLYTRRSVRAAAFDGSEWKQLADVAAAIPPEIRRFVQQPRIAIDAEGRLYLALRSRVSATVARMDYWASGGRWETFLTHLDGENWTPAVPMPSSTGRNSMQAALALHRANAHVVWPTDHRAWPSGRYGDLGIYAASMEISGAPSKLSGGASVTPVASQSTNAHPNENADTRRIRAHRISLGGKQYRILRGDLHRHTELSQDGAGDGSLDDLYRYFLDAAQMDYAHVADHQMGVDEDYNWWFTQKSNDLYLMPQRFVPLYGYERSVRYPNGHRNIVWAERGKPVLRIGPAEMKGGVNTGSMLYPYLRDTNGIATSHTSATEQGTDWRDNDPSLEPLVEIYQGFESSYEHAGAPRSWKAGEAKVHRGERPAGYIWNAWAKGYKLGVQSSSDHVSTHSSYACILVEDFTRQGLVDAMRQRHAYAATDQIVLDYRIETADAGAALMGDILTTALQPKLRVRAIGAASIRQIDVIKNNTYIHKVTPNQKEAAFDFVDTAERAAEVYYYVRVEQADGQLAWSSPIWIRKK